MKKILALLLFIAFVVGANAQTFTFTANQDNLQSANVFQCPGMFTNLTISVLPIDTPYAATLLMNGNILEQGVYSSINPQSPQIFLLNSLIYAGNYNLQVTGASGTVYDPLSFSFLDPTPISFSTTTTAPISCLDGNILVQNLQGGTPPYDLGTLNGGVFDAVYAEQISTSFYSIDDLSAGSYSITAQDDWGCQFSVGTVNPIVLPAGVPAPELSVNMGSDIEFCVQGGSPPYNFAWADTSVATFNTCIPLEVCWGDYTITVVDNENCEDEVVINIPETEGYIDQFTASVVIESEGAPPYTYAWYLNGSLLEEETEAALLSNMCAGFYEAVVTDYLGCSYIFELTIDELESNLVEEVDCFDTQLITLEASAQGGTAPYAYLWSTGETTDIITNLSPQAYSLQLTDNNGCTLTKEVAIPLITDSCLYNAFSPNGDLVNDVWVINPSFLYEDSEVKIYNRWGKKVFDSVGYQEPWKGTNNAGNPLSEGVYFYVVLLHHDEEPLKGNVTIFK